MNETVHLFGRSNSLVGVLTIPERPTASSSAPAVIILNSGMVHRVGFNRLSVKMARALAGQGLTAFRFDFNGVGDSAIRNDNLTFAESAVTETLEAMDYLQQTAGVGQFMLIGICSGAVVALKAALRDRRVSALVPINIRNYRSESLTPSDHDTVSLHYYWRVKFNPVSWKRLLTGATDYSRLTRVLARLGKNLAFWCRKEEAGASELLADLEALFKTDITVHLIYAQGDLGLDYIQVHFRGEPNLVIIPDADHLFTHGKNQEALLDELTGFASQLVNGGQNSCLPSSSGDSSPVRKGRSRKR